ncbi:unnamed protein product [Amaranthus hypochondriacus]
MKRTII